MVAEINVGTSAELKICATVKNSNKFGSVKLIINDLELGTYEEEQALGIVPHQLLRIANTEILDEGIVPEDVEEAFEYLDNESSGKYYLSMGECFDDFSIRGYSDGDSVHLYWEMSDEPFFEYHDVIKGISYGIVSKANLQGVADKFKKMLN